MLHVQGPFVGGGTPAQRRTCLESLLTAIEENVNLRVLSMSAPLQAVRCLLHGHQLLPRPRSAAPVH